MNILDLLDTVTQSGGRLILDGDALTIEAPEPLPDEMIDAIRQHKAELIGHLREDTKSNNQPYSVKDFVTQCCTLGPEDNTKGGDLYTAFAQWRCVVHAEDGTLSWQELTASLQSQECELDVRSGSPVWRGIKLREADVPPYQYVETCAQCHASDIFVKGPVRVCKSCRHEWLLPCLQCSNTKWGMLKGQWTCRTCGHIWEPHIDLRKDVPTLLTTIKTTDGKQLTLGIYRCPGCGGTNWGPRIDDPDTWWCLTCHAAQFLEITGGGKK